MTVKEWKAANPGTPYYAVWAGDTKGGFGRKGWSAYGDCDNCDVVKVEIDGKYPRLHIWDYKHFGDLEAIA